MGPTATVGIWGFGVSLQLRWMSAHAWRFTRRGRVPDKLAQKLIEIGSPGAVLILLLSLTISGLQRPDVFVREPGLRSQYYSSEKCRQRGSPVCRYTDLTLRQSTNGQEAGQATVRTSYVRVSSSPDPSLGCRDSGLGEVVRSLGEVTRGRTPDPRPQAFLQRLVSSGNQARFSPSDLTLSFSPAPAPQRTYLITTKASETAMAGSPAPRRASIGTGDPKGGILAPVKMLHSGRSCGLVLADGF
ncbi:hypothetical protein F4780DRAFT_297412 [Xylariomycetidae sp. FL0641]|nr:hypothetical protein F4780DRAFT_297412 [Xylariomycetidae sp. FL0641]